MVAARPAMDCFHGCCAAPFISLPQCSQAKSSTARLDFAAATAASLLPNTQFTNHESLPSYADSFSHFTRAYPQYIKTDQADRIREHEYQHLSDHVCLDYMGLSLFSYSQQYAQNLSVPSSSSAPHPMNLEFPFFEICYKSASLQSQVLYGGQESELECSIRKRIMSFLNISEIDYSMVFTANHTSAFKLVAESYPFKSNRKLLTVYDYESEAVESMISSSRKRGAKVMSAEFSWPRERVACVARCLRIGTKGNGHLGSVTLSPGFSYLLLLQDFRRKPIWVRLPIREEVQCFTPRMLNHCQEHRICKSRSCKESNTLLGRILIILWSLSSRASSEMGERSSSLNRSRTFEGHVQGQAEAVARQEEPVSSEIVELENPKTSTSTEASIMNQEKTVTMECRGLDHADSLGLVNISYRARCQINWLVNALSKLQHPHSDKGFPLVRIYGQKVRLERGAAVAFNIFDWKGEKVEPVLVQKLADRSNISLSYGFLQNICFSDKYEEEKERVLETRISNDTTEPRGAKKKGKVELGINVVTAALGFLSNFEDTYRLWAFVAQFLDADFLEKERWRYVALNQRIVEV
ncbi:hypothetical protein Sjap_020712 [Stephania japonica]|uniref:Molybdenum cofactor sulfurase n=1 Tax=Stephania japonica TaxID=461633 RepID=A0AAP0F6J0_9MAGN